MSKHSRSSARAEDAPDDAPAPAPQSLVAGHVHATSSGEGMDDEQHAHSTTAGDSTSVSDHAHCEPIPFQVPTIEQLTPSEDVAAGGAALIITGADFLGGMTAAIGGVAVAPAPGYVNPMRFEGTVPPGAVGTHDVTVTTAGGTATHPASFTYT